VAADPAVRAVIVTGRERRFCAGADIAMLQDLSPQNQARALQLMMEGRRLGADEARSLGLVDEVVPADLLQQTTRDVAERLAAGPTRAIGLLKRCVYQGYGRPLEEGLAIEGEAVSDLIRTSDAREGMAAFLAKRPPRFTGA
jgi:enoyl-CoA hydratase/carnithine racemase